MVFIETMPKNNEKEKKDNARKKNAAKERTPIERILTRLLKITLIYKPVEKIKVLLMPKRESELMLV